MKIDKYLKKTAEEDRESLINDRDIEFLASIGVDYTKKFPEPIAEEKPAEVKVKANHANILMGLSCATVILLATVLILVGMFFGWFGELKYSDIVIDKVAQTDPSDFNNDAKTVCIDVQNVEELKIDKYYSKEVNLYYSASIVGSQLPDVNFIIYMPLSENAPEWNYSLDGCKVAEYYGLNLDYKLMLGYVDGVFNGITFVSRLDTGSVSLYISCESKNLYTEEQIIEELKTIIKVKQ